MANALDMFRAQREAADRIHARLAETGELLVKLQIQVDALTANQELRSLLRQQQTWLEQLQLTLVEVRRLRDQEQSPLWPGVWRRWVLAVFALAAAAAAGAGYAWVTEPSAGELDQLPLPSQSDRRRGTSSEVNDELACGIFPASLAEIA